jgi:Aspartyl protease
MQIVGEWWLCDDGVTRPSVETLVLGAGGQNHSERFLIDSGADQTVLSADLLSKLQLPPQQPPAGLALAGISGTSPSVVVDTVIEFTRAGGGPARVRGQMPAFTDPAATDLSILGRDVLDNFDVILSRPRNEILLLTGNHRYVVQ